MRSVGQLYRAHAAVVADVEPHDSETETDPQSALDVGVSQPDRQVRRHRARHYPVVHFHDIDGQPEILGRTGHFEAEESGADHHQPPSMSPVPHASRRNRPPVAACHPPEGKPPFTPKVCSVTWSG